MVDQRDEFISEAQEIIEGLARDLLALDAAIKKPAGAGGGHDHELINDAFRAIHTLKGLSSLFGVQRMSTLSHHLDALDRVRRGCRETRYRRSAASNAVRASSVIGRPSHSHRAW